MKTQRLRKLAICPKSHRESVGEKDHNLSFSTFYCTIATLLLDDQQNILIIYTEKGTWKVFFWSISV